MSFQIVNAPTLNCPQNTCVFCCFEADDNVTNLHIAQDHFQDQVEELQIIKWRLVQKMFLQTGDFNLQRHIKSSYFFAVTMTFSVRCLAFQELAVC